MTTPIHAALQTKDLLPADHLVDTAYFDAELLVTSQETYGVNLVGPTRMDTGWQARQEEGGFAAENFVVDWERQQATCPGGKTSQYWQPAKDTRGNDTIHIRFSKKDCGPCPLHLQCTRSQPPRRTCTVRPQPQQLALQAARDGKRPKLSKNGHRRTDLGLSERLFIGAVMNLPPKVRDGELARKHLSNQSTDAVPHRRAGEGKPIGRSKPAGRANGQ